MIWTNYITLDLVMAASLRSKKKISKILDKINKETEAEAVMPSTCVKDKHCKQDPDDSYLSKLLCVYEEHI